MKIFSANLIVILMNDKTLPENVKTFKDETRTI